MKELKVNEAKYAEMQKSGADAAELKKFKEHALDDTQKVLDQCKPAILKAFNDLKDLMASYLEGPSGGIADEAGLKLLKATEEWQTAQELIDIAQKNNMVP